MRGCRRPRFPPIPALENFRYMRRRPRTAPDVQQRPHHVPHLPIKKPAALHVNTYFVQVAFNITAKDGSDHGLTFPPRRRHRRKILLPDKMGPGLLHLFDIQRQPEMKCVPMHETLDGPTPRIENAITIQLAYGAMRGVKFGMDLAHFENGKVRRESRTDRVLQFAAVEPARRMKVGHLPGGMNPRVGPSASDEIDGMANRPADGRLKQLLNSPLAGLRLPAMKISSVVGYLKTNVAMHATIVPEVFRVYMSWMICRSVGGRIEHGVGRPWPNHMAALRLTIPREKSAD